MVTQEEMQNMSPEQLAELQKQNCIFCHIIAGRAKAKKVFEDETVTAVLDINPASPGHILLLPKKHYVIMPQIPEYEVGHIFMVAKSLSNVLLKAMKAKGTNIFVANGAVAGQKAPHFMVHIIPRHENDGLNFIPPEIDISEQQLEEIRQRLLPKIKEIFNMTDDDMKRLGAITDNNEDRENAGEEKEKREEDKDNKDDEKHEIDKKPVKPGSADIDLEQLKRILDKDEM